jgi:hypothetical protein
VNLALIVGWLAVDDGTIVDSGPVPEGRTAPGTALADLRDHLAAEGIGYLGMMVLGMHGAVVDDFGAAEVDWFREAGVEINFITDEPDVMRSYIDRGVSSILTNHPERLTALLGDTTAA